MFVNRYYYLLKIVAISFVSVFCFLFPDIFFYLIHAFIVQLFEILEGALDEVVEHFFHTDRHTTQMIVFYLMWVMFIFSAVKLLRKLLSKVKKIRSDIDQWWQIQIVKSNTVWQALFHYHFKHLMVFSGIGSLFVGYMFL